MKATLTMNNCGELTALGAIAAPLQYNSNTANNCFCGITLFYPSSWRRSTSLLNTTSYSLFGSVGVICTDLSVNPSCIQFPVFVTVWVFVTRDVRTQSYLHWSVQITRTFNVLHYSRQVWPDRKSDSIADEDFTVSEETLPAKDGSPRLRG